MKKNWGLLIIRVVFGLTFAGHGAQKLFGWFGGGGLAGTAKFMESIGFAPGTLWAAMAGLGEMVGGLLLALGLFTPVAAFLITSAMLVAIVKVTGPKGYWITKGGSEYTWAIIAAAVGVALTGPGDLTVKALLRKSGSEPRNAG